MDTGDQQTFIKYEIADVFSVGPSRLYITRASRSSDQKRERPEARRRQGEDRSEMSQPDFRIE
jgi:hypothetical protein